MYYFRRKSQEAKTPARYSEDDVSQSRFGKSPKSGFSYPSREPSPSTSVEPSDERINPMFSAEEPTDTFPDPVEGGWGKYEDEKGKTYFFNSKTGETQWIAPRGWKEEVQPPVEKPKSQAEMQGWGKYMDEQGRTYYFNTESGETQWVPPSGWIDDEALSTPSSDKLTSSSVGATKSLKKQGWDQYSDDKGRIYFFNTNTGQTLWTPPEGWVDDDEEENIKEVSNASSSVQKTPTMLLMEQGWGKHVDDKGKTYYFNTNTGETMWMPPEGWINDEEGTGGGVRAPRLSVLRAARASTGDSDDEMTDEVAQPSPAPKSRGGNRSSLLMAGEKAADAAKSATSLAERLAAASSKSKTTGGPTPKSDIDRDL